MKSGDHSHMNGHGTIQASDTPTSKGPPPAPYVMKEPSFKFRRFEETILGQNVAFEVLKMVGSVYIWVGSASQNAMENTCLALPTRFNPLPLTSTWMGEPDAASPTAQKLSVKLKKPVVLSFNIVDLHAVPQVEQALFNDIRSNEDAY